MGACRDKWGFCHAHSNCRAAIFEGKPWTNNTIYHSENVKRGGGPPKGATVLFSTRRRV
jgi:hypothetical protein